VHGTYRERKIRGRADSSYIDPILLDQGASGLRRNEGGTQGDQRDVRERTDQATTGGSVCLRERQSNRMDKAEGVQDIDIGTASQPALVA
jgi:hypothetical protein